MLILSPRIVQGQAAGRAGSIHEHHVGRASGKGLQQRFHNRVGGTVQAHAGYVVAGLAQLAVQAGQQRILLKGIARNIRREQQNVSHNGRAALSKKQPTAALRT